MSEALKEIAKDYMEQFVCNKCGGTLNVEVDPLGIRSTLNARCTNPQCEHSIEKKGEADWQNKWTILDPHVIARLRLPRESPKQVVANGLLNAIKAKLIFSGLYTPRFSEIHFKEYIELKKLLHKLEILLLEAAAHNDNIIIYKRNASFESKLVVINETYLVVTSYEPVTGVQEHKYTGINEFNIQDISCIEIEEVEK